MSSLVYSGEIDDDFLVKLIERNPRHLTLCSGGGYLRIMRASVDYLAANPTSIHVTGDCMSAAVAILACGVEGCRTASPNTVLMIHKAWTSMSQTDSDELATESEQMTKEQLFYWAVLGARTKRKAAWWQKQCATKPLYFTADDALKWGLIDGIA